MGSEMCIRDSANTISIMHGVVAQVERSDSTNVHLKVRVGQETVKVHLGPAKYVDARIQLSKNDKVQFTGSHMTIEGQPFVLATLITTKDTTVHLREMDGKPLFHGSQLRTTKQADRQ